MAAALPSLAKLSNKEVIASLKSSRSREREETANVVLHIHEVDKRGIYRDEGYPSLFAYCMEDLGFSKDETYRRTTASRVLEGSPEIYWMLKSGEITLSSVCEVKPVLTEENKNQVITLLQGKSKTSAQEVAMMFGAPEKPKRETVRVRKVALPQKKDESFAPARVEEERHLFSFEVSKETRDLIEEARGMLGPVKYAELFEKMAREFVEKRKLKAPRVRKAATERKAAQSPQADTSVEPTRRNTRVIPRSIKRAVISRDEGQCTFVGETGRRCCEKHRLQFDHIQPFARGGSSEIDNLRLLCPAHNQLMAEREFGREYVREKRRASRMKNLVLNF